MFNLNFVVLPCHTYSLAATGLKLRSKKYGSRDSAEKAMYKLCGKLGLQIHEQYHDNHDRTYICNNGIRFYIQRV